ncbi:MAG: class I SAM-dependent methyltransferase [Bacillota bacterium]
MYPRLEPPAVRAWRQAAAGEATGRVLEIGIGPGLNLPFYRPGVELFGLDPDPAMLRYAKRRAAFLGFPLTLVRGEAERIPFPTGFFDGAVSIFAFCSVRRPEAAAREVFRVLRPGGRLFFLEHVRAEGEGWAFIQRLVTPPWSLLAGGCHLARDTLADFVRAGFVFEEPPRRLSGGLLPVRVGRALRPDRCFQKSP